MADQTETLGTRQSSAERSAILQHLEAQRPAAEQPMTEPRETKHATGQSAANGSATLRRLAAQKATAEQRVADLAEPHAFVSRQST